MLYYVGNNPLFVVIMLAATVVACWLLLRLWRILAPRLSLIRSLLTALHVIARQDKALAESKLMAMQERFQPDSQRSRDDLEHLRSTARSLDALFPNFGEEALSEIATKGIPTLSDNLLKTSYTTLLRGLPSPLRPILERIPVGSLEFRGLDTTMAVMDGGSCYIVVNSGMWVYLHGLTKLICSRVKVPGMNLGYTMPWQKYLECVASLVLNGPRYRSVPYWPGPENPGLIMLLSLLEAGQDLFILGHELAHCLHGDLSEAHTWTPLEPEDLLDSRRGQMFEAMKENLLIKGSEIAADHLGARLALRAIRNSPLARDDTSLMYAGIDSFFTYVHLLERVELREPHYRTFLVRQMIKGHHPPAIIRRDLWRKDFGKSIHREGLEIAVGIEQLVEQTVEDLLSRKYGAIEDLAARAATSAL